MKIEERIIREEKDCMQALILPVQKVFKRSGLNGAVIKFLLNSNKAPWISLLNLYPKHLF